MSAEQLRWFSKMPLTQAVESTYLRESGARGADGDHDEAVDDAAATRAEAGRLATKDWLTVMGLLKHWDEPEL